MTPEQLDIVVEFVANRMAYCTRKTKIRRLVSITLYGPSPDNDALPIKFIDQFLFEKLIKKARTWMMERAAVNAIEARQDSIAFYESFIADDKISAKAKVKARENLDKIMKVEGAGVENVNVTMVGQKLNLSDMNLTIEQKKAILEQLRGNAGTA